MVNATQWCCNLEKQLAAAGTGALLFSKGKDSTPPMLFKVIIFVVISCLSGVIRPIYGGFAGSISAPVMSVLFSPFDLPTVLVLIPFGFGFGLLCGRASWWLVRGSHSTQQQTKPYVMPITRGGGGGQRGEIIFTDEEAKNAEDNKDPIK